MFDLDANYLLVRTTEEKSVLTEIAIEFLNSNSFSNGINTNYGEFAALLCSLDLDSSIKSNILKELILNYSDIQFITAAANNLKKEEFDNIYYSADMTAHNRFYMLFGSDHIDSKQLKDLLNNADYLTSDTQRLDFYKYAMKNKNISEHQIKRIIRTLRKIDFSTKNNIMLQKLSVEESLLENQNLNINKLKLLGPDFFIEDAKSYGIVATNYSISYEDLKEVPSFLSATSSWINLLKLNRLQANKFLALKKYFTRTDTSKKGKSFMFELTNDTDFLDEEVKNIFIF